jgi:hypothetical protein
VTALQKKPLDVGQRLAGQSARLDEPARAALAQFPRGELPDEELEQHIDDLAWSWRTAYDRFQTHGVRADREEALMLLRLHNRAVLARSPAAQAARWAEIEEAIDNGVGFFDARGREARAAMDRGA